MLHIPVIRKAASRIYREAVFYTLKILWNIVLFFICMPDATGTAGTTRDVAVPADAGDGRATERRAEESDRDK